MHVEQLAIDYCQLFIGPADHLPPFQSVWQSGQFHGSTTASMREFVDPVGYEATAGIMLDHPGVQLGIMGHVLGQVPSWQSDADRLHQVLALSHA